VKYSSSSRKVWTPPVVDVRTRYRNGAGRLLLGSLADDVDLERVLGIGQDHAAVGVVVAHVDVAAGVVDAHGPIARISPTHLEPSCE
jgi:hypothetical protein